MTGSMVVKTLHCNCDFRKFSMVNITSGKIWMSWQFSQVSANSSDTTQQKILYSCIKIQHNKQLRYNIVPVLSHTVISGLLSSLSSPGAGRQQFEKAGHGFGGARRRRGMGGLTWRGHWWMRIGVQGPPGRPCCAWLPPRTPAWLTICWLLHMTSPLSCPPWLRDKTSGSRWGKTAWGWTFTQASLSNSIKTHFYLLASVLTASLKEQSACLI